MRGLQHVTPTTTIPLLKSRSTAPDFEFFKKFEERFLILDTCMRIHVRTSSTKCSAGVPGAAPAPKMALAFDMFQNFISNMSLLALVASTLVVGLLSKLIKRIKHDKSHLLRHVVITGGSSGIGLSVAKQIIEKIKEEKVEVARITLIARGAVKLREAQTMLKSIADEKGVDVSIHVLISDISNFKQVQTIIKPEMDKFPPTMLFNVAGTSISGYVESTPMEMYEKLMSINYIGTVNVTRVCLPYLRKEGGAIAFTSSAAGQVGVFGYTAYSPSKFAITGFVEALAMEVLPDNVSVTIAFPPDTDTPGYKEEQKCKPKETDLISDAAGLFKPDE